MRSSILNPRSSLFGHQKGISKMNEGSRTATFVGVAGFSALLAVFTQWQSRPEPLEEFAKVGKEFYKDFDDSLAARALEVIDYDEDIGNKRDFKVKYEDGVWRIPSHHGYPADAENKMEKAAASLIGIVREGLASQRQEDHARLGVIDPDDEDETKLEGRGQRIRVWDGSDQILADYIIGKKVKGSEDQYFIRLPDEKETYRAKLELDISAKFADWVEEDLLKIERETIIEIVQKTQEVEDVAGPLGVRVKRFVGEPTLLTLHREKDASSSAWEVAGLKEDEEEVDSDGVRNITTALDGLELKGVRKKLQGLTAELKIDQDAFPKDEHPQSYFQQVVRSLQGRGFILAAAGPAKDDDSPPPLQLLGEGGELVAKNDEGLIYHLHFGSLITGTEEDIQIGTDEEASAEVPEGDEKKDSKDEPKSDGDKKPKTSINRFMFVRVEFDPTIIGERPVEPTEPVKPAELDDPKPAEAKEPEGDNTDADGEKEIAPPKKDETEETPKEDPKAKLQAEYDKQLKEYERAQADYKDDLEKFEKELRESEKKAKELNDRFKDWYYVITEESYDKLKFTRDDIVKLKEKKEGEDPASTIPQTDKPAEAEKPNREPAGETE